MDPKAIVALVVLAVAAGLLYAWNSRRTLRLMEERLAKVRPEAERDDESEPLRPLLRRYGWLPWAIGAVIGLSLYLFLDLRAAYCLAVALLTSLLGGQIEAMLHERRVHLIETQLADAIDLMVGGLRAGAGVLNTLDNAAREAQRPLQDQLHEAVGRIRLGDDAQDVFRQFAERVPLETFILFASALSIHWEVGGSLAPTLSTVGRTIRDRIELTRRIRSMSAQSRMSVIGVLIATYAIAVIMWSNDPERFERFLTSDMGSMLAAGVIVMQAVGIVWSSSIARIRF
jgi:tight adherence protein B